MMKISEKRRSEIYSAIYEPVINLRATIAREGLSKSQIDRRLFDLVDVIWRKQFEVLNMDGHP